ncbi:MAG: universal stress protein [Nitrospirota bacterium]
MKQHDPVSKILLPVDGSEDSRRAVQFAGCMGAALSKSLSGITLLHVTAEGYFSRHMGYIDFRAEDLLQTEAFKKIKNQYIEERIKPFLDQSEKILIDLGVEVKIEKLIVDGDPASEIVRIADERRFSTIIMARRGLSELKGSFMGSVTGKVVHTASNQTVYVVGYKVLEDKTCPIPKILIPVDGSIYSMKGVEHAASLAKKLRGPISGITLLRVINIALFEERLKERIDPEEEAKRILEEAKAVFLKAGVSEELITIKMKMGNPAEEILKEAEEEQYNLVVMGRKGRSALKDLFLGGVSTTVLQRCQNPTIAIVSA